MNQIPPASAVSSTSVRPIRCPHCGGKLAEADGRKLTIKRSGLQAEFVADNGRVTFTCNWPRCRKKFIHQLHRNI